MGASPHAPAKGGRRLPPMDYPLPKIWIASVVRLSEDWGNAMKPVSLTLTGDSQLGLFRSYSKQNHILDILSSL